METVVVQKTAAADVPAIYSSEQIRDKIKLLPISQIILNRNNPRKQHDDQSLEELSESIKHLGLMQPIGVNPIDGSYTLVWGERRFLAAKMAGLTSILAVVFEPDEKNVLQYALTENIMRKDLTVMEEARAFSQLIGEKNASVKDVALLFGKKEEFVRTRIALLSLIYEFQEMVELEKLSLGKAYQLVRYDQEIQRQVYTNNFKEEGTHNWNNLSTTEFGNLMQATFSCNLDQYNFSKEDCRTCSYNLANHSLFQEQAVNRCLKRECLDNKKNEFVVQGLNYVLSKNPDFEVCISSRDTLPETVKAYTEEQAVHISKLTPLEYPCVPAKPERTDFKSEGEFQEADIQYQEDLEDYKTEMKAIESKIQEGTHKQVFYIGDNRPRICYVERSEPEPAETSSPEESFQDKQEKLKNECIERITKDVLKKFNSILPDDEELSLMEYRLLAYLLLPYLKPEIIRNLKLAKTAKRLNDEELYTLYKKITEQQIHQILRAFIFQNIKQFSGVSKKNFVFNEYMNHCFPAEYAAIAKPHMEKLKKENEKLVKRFEKINKRISPATGEPATEQPVAKTGEPVESVPEIEMV